MKYIPHLGKVLVLLMLSLFIYSCSSDDDSNNNDDDVSMTDDDPDTGDTDGTDDTDSGDDNDVSSLNIVELAQSVDDLSSLVIALTAVDESLVEALSDDDATYTVFAPTNAAFDALLEELDGFESLEDFDEESELELLTEILEYHVIEGFAAFSTDLSDGQTLETLQSETLTVNLNGGVFIQDKTDEPAEVTGADNEASNGVVHIIDKILLPQAVIDALTPLPTVVEIVQGTNNLSLLEEALITAGLVETLNGDGPFTIFGPTNEAIEELFDLLGDDYNSFDDFDTSLELDLLEDILLYHVIAGYVTTDDLFPGTSPVTLSGDQTIDIIASDGTVVIGDASDVDANILEADALGVNGVVHVIDKILISQEVADLLESLGIDIDDFTGSGDTSSQTVAEVISSDADFSFLQEALEITGLLPVLDNEDEAYTVFAPSVELLNTLSFLLGEVYDSLSDFDTTYEIDLLRDVLLFHVVSGTVTSSDLSPGTVNTLLGDAIEVVAKDGTLVLRDATSYEANLKEVDIIASNGVIHSINRILLPQSVIDQVVTDTEDTLGDIITYLEDEGNQEMMEELMIMYRHEFEDVLENTEAFTFFLPTLEAFEELFEDLGIHQITDIDTEEELKLILTTLSYHLVLDVQALSTDLTDGQVVPTLQGETLEVDLENGVQILDKSGIPANVVEADLMIANGVVHVMDKVLLPMEVIQIL